MKIFVSIFAELHSLKLNDGFTTQIAILFVCDTVNTGFDIALVWNPLVAKYGMH